MSQSKKPALPKTFTTIPHVVCAHPAFLTMKFAHQVVLIDMFRQVQRWTTYGSTQLDPEGFPYGYAHCCCLASRATWKRAIADIELRGFFARNHLARGPGILPRWHYSRAWRTYQPQAAHRVELTALEFRVVRQERTDQRQLELNLTPSKGSIPPHPLAQIWRRTGVMQAQIEPALSLLEIQDTTKERARAEEPTRPTAQRGQPEAVTSILARAIRPN